MGFLSDLFNIQNEENKSSEDEEVKKIMDTYGLEKEESKLVNDGEYNETDFEEDGTEDDDYYGEDS